MIGKRPLPIMLLASLLFSFTLIPFPAYTYLIGPGWLDALGALRPN